MLSGTTPPITPKAGDSDGVPDESGGEGRVRRTPLLRGQTYGVFALRRMQEPYDEWVWRMKLFPVGSPVGRLSFNLDALSSGVLPALLIVVSLVVFLCILHQESSDTGMGGRSGVDNQP